MKPVDLFGVVRRLIEPATGRTLQWYDQLGLDAGEDEAVCLLDLAV